MWSQNLISIGVEESVRLRQRVSGDIRLSSGRVGVLVEPMLAAVGAVGAALANCTVEVIRTALSRRVSQRCDPAVKLDPRIVTR
jgi:hypothetical protein